MPEDPPDYQPYEDESWTELGYEDEPEATG